jgi:hypothetical protein
MVIYTSEEARSIFGKLYGMRSTRSIALVEVRWGKVDAQTIGNLTKILEKYRCI